MAITKELKDALEKMQAKDETAFATFYEQTYSYVYALVDRMPFFWFSKKFGWFNSHIVPTQDNLVYEGMVSGCCFIVRKDILNSDHTLFDDNVFLYSEERILGIKIRELGYLVKYCPKTFIFHIEGNSTSKISSAFADYHRYISDYYTVVRYCTTNGFQRLLFKVLRLANFKGKVLKNSDYKERYRLLKRKMKEIDNHDYKIGY